jgi:anti-sigma regulatory factor (Ser/Thr protein kinase)
MTKLTSSVLPRPEAISELTDSIMAFLNAQHVDARATHHVALIVAEILTNLGTYGNCGDKPARITITVGPVGVEGEIVDSGSRFDPRDAPAPNLDLAPEDRAVGGLGLFLVRQFSYKFEHEYRNGENHTMFAVARA